MLPSCWDLTAEPENDCFLFREAVERVDVGEERRLSRI